ncbi:hypothetical protein Q8F55_008715 [Vanrija albida]|uniref:Uncharacterized protein n=1 Tax=Vanrija albida TaxID=181172 RepID=A0ABR3PRV7_9TREE
MVTTRAGSRQASEALATPTKPAAGATSAAASPSARARARKASPPGAAPLATGKTYKPLADGAGPSARRRARQKDRVRALKASAGVAAATEAKVDSIVLAAALYTALMDQDDASVCISRVARSAAAGTGMDWEDLLGATRAAVLDAARDGRVELLGPSFSGVDADTYLPRHF